jgi:hypothetical protein
LGAQSAVTLLASDAFLLRHFCETYLPRHALCEAVSAATSQGQLEKALDALSAAIKADKAIVGCLVRAGVCEVLTGAMAQFQTSTSA